MPPDLTREAAIAGPVAGIDEAGRGPWAGPVMAAAVILPPDRFPPGLDDSKRLSAAMREKLYDAVRAEAVATGIGLAEVEEIDRLNILAATELAMCRAVAALGIRPVACLVDGNRVPKALPVPGRAVIGGDRLAASIAAASILAKVTRDRLMISLAAAFPDYGWERNKGYGTAAHRNALERYGVSPHHRRSFKPIHNLLS
ncbi:MAG: ribonuclease HII [Pseudomonadota bacterium]